MNPKRKLQAFFDTEKDEKKLIVTYEENIAFFNDLLRSSHKEDIESVIYVKMKYIYSLETEGYYSKALKALDELEKDLEKLKGWKWYYGYSERIVFMRGLCLGRLKKYRESNRYFKQLITKKPVNDNYLDWYKSNIQHQIREISNPILAVAACVLPVNIILRHTKVLDYKTFLIIDISALSLLLIVFAGSWIWRKIIEKQRVKIKQRIKANS